MVSLYSPLIRLLRAINATTIPSAMAMISIHVIVAVPPNYCSEWVCAYIMPEGEGACHRLSCRFRSSPVAEFIDEHSALKPVVRAALLPSVGISEAAVGMSLAMKTVIVGLVLLASVLAALSLRRRSVPGKA